MTGPSMSTLQALVGQTFGPSDWLAVSQEVVNGFAEATGDHQWIHVDPERAATGSPYGQTVAHGMFTLSLAPALAMALVPLGGALVINYGLERVRFPAPVLVGSRVRMWAHVAEAKAVAQGTQLAIDARFESDEQQKPVCVARLLFIV